MLFPSIFKVKKSLDYLNSKEKSLIQAIFVEEKKDLQMKSQLEKQRRYVNQAKTRIQIYDPRKYDTKFLNDLKKESMAYKRKYETIMQSHIKVLVKMIQDLSQIIHTEELELRYEFEKPVEFMQKIFSTAQQALKVISHNRFAKTAQFNSQVKNITKYLTRIEDKIVGFLEENTNFIRKEYKQLNHKSINVFLIDLDKERKNIRLFLEQRTSLKRKFNGKINYIIKEIVNAEKELNKIKVKPEIVTKTLTFLKDAREKMEYLKGYYEQRLKLSEKIITQSVRLQKKKVENLRKMHNDIKNFYSVFKEEQIALLNKELASDHIKKLAKKRIGNIANTKAKVEMQVQEAESCLQNYDIKGEKRTQRIIRKEALEFKKLRYSLDLKSKGVKRNARRVLVGAMALANLSFVPPSNINTEQPSTNIKKNIQKVNLHQHQDCFGNTMHLFRKVDVQRAFESSSVPSTISPSELKKTGAIVDSMGVNENDQIIVINPQLIEEINSQLASPEDLEFFLPMASEAKITSPIGMRNHPILKKKIFHKGTDMISATGIVYSAQNGTARVSSSDVLGNYIIIENPVFKTVYAHLKTGSIRIKNGQKVKAGQQIAQMGNTGRSTNTHLHFEVIVSANSLGNHIGKDIRLSINPKSHDSIQYYLAHVNGNRVAEMENFYGSNPYIVSLREQMPRSYNLVDSKIPKKNYIKAQRKGPK